MNNSDKPAFAKSAYISNEGSIDPPQEGLTKREYFAGLAMQGLLANPNGGKTSGGSPTFSPDGVAALSLLHADELLRQLDK